MAPVLEFWLSPVALSKAVSETGSARKVCENFSSYFRLPDDKAPAAAAAAVAASTAAHANTATDAAASAALSHYGAPYLR